MTTHGFPNTLEEVREYLAREYPLKPPHSDPRVRLFQALDTLRSLVTSIRSWQTLEDLLLLLQAIGLEWKDWELQNLVRRLKAAVREEPSSTMLWALQAQAPEAPPTRSHLQQSILEAIQELWSDLEDWQANINEQATQQLQDGLVVLTVADDRTIASFLQAAAKKRQLRVVLVGKSSTIPGLEAVECIGETAVFAYMSRVDKVLLPARAVLANGGLVSGPGTHAMALAAHAHAVPVLGVAGVSQLRSIYPHQGSETMNEWLAPQMDYGKLARHTSVHWVQPKYDYIAPEWIRLYITNVGAYPPSFIYRLLAEYYPEER